MERINKRIDYNRSSWAPFQFVIVLDNIRGLIAQEHESLDL